MAEIVDMHARRKLQQLAKDQGFKDTGSFIKYLLESGKGFDSVVPGICMNPGCNYKTDECEPDAESNWCENCGTSSVRSVLLLP